MKYDNHAKTQWTIRGSATKTLLEAWREGIEVICPDHYYDEARLDTETNTVLLASSGWIDTVITNYESEKVHFKIPVNCFGCGAHHMTTGECNNCGSQLWNLR